MDLLRQHFPLLLSVTDEWTAGHPDPRFVRWMTTAKRELDAYRTEQRSQKKRAEADKVAEGYAAAARLVDLLRAGKSS